MSAVQVERALVSRRVRAVLPMALRVMVGLSVTAIAVLAVVFFVFALPAWDDLVRATGPSGMGWFHYVFGVMYFHWQGRWTSCGLEALVLPRVDITRFYGWLVGAVALVDLAGMYVLCRWFTPNCSRGASAGLTACLAALLWTGLPSPAEAVYWFVGAVENSMVLALAAMLVIAMIRLSSSTDRSVVSNIIRLLFCPAAACICGFHELYGAMLCLALLTGSAWAMVNPAVNRSMWISVTLSAAAGLVIVVLAPGNSHRLAVDGVHGGRQLTLDLKVAVWQAIDFIPRWLINPRLLSASLWVAVTPILRKSRPENPLRWALLLVWLLMLAIGFFAPSWAFGARMPGRTLSGIHVIFVVGWLIVVYTWTRSQKVQQALMAWPRENLLAVACIVFSVSLLTMGNSIAAVRDLRDKLLPWHRAVENRYAQLRGETGRDAAVPMLPASPMLLLSGETVADSHDYRNWSLVSFFKLRSLRLISGSDPLPPSPGSPTVPPGGQ